MSHIDKLISTDSDGTEHWERWIEPETAQDYIISYFYRPDYYLDYVDGTGEIGFEHVYMELGTWLNPGLEVVTRGVATLWFEAIDLPDDSVVDSYRFDTAAFIGSFNKTTPVANIFEEWDYSIRPEGPGDPALAEMQADQSTNPAVMPIGGASFDMDAQFAEVAWDMMEYSLDLTMPASGRAATGQPFALRFRTDPALISGGDGGFYHDESFADFTLATAWGDPRYVSFPPDFVPYNPRFVVCYSVLSVQPEIPELIPAFHTARRVLNSTRQPAIVVGTNPR